MKHHPASSPSVAPVPIREIQQHIGAAVDGRPEMRITGVNALETAQPGELSFAETPKYLPQVRASRASAIIVSKTFPAVEGPLLLRVEHPRLAFVKVMYLFQPKFAVQTGVHRDAVVAPDTELGEGVTIRECAVVRSRARIGAGTVIESGAYIGEEVTIGERCFIGPNVVIMYGSRIGHRVILHGGTVIGADGFGFVWAEGHHMKIPQLGNVIVEDDVELGANVCVDRATFGSTVVKRGTKVDNLVQIAHNDVIGEDVILSGQVGLAGSVQIGNRAMLGGQAGVADHVTVGPDGRVGAASAVFKDVPAGASFWGTPARPLARVKRELAALAFLPKLIKQLGRSVPKDEHEDKDEAAGRSPRPR
jgi:UDP-3-O-[3-hydroxymyristoyl] glucosamine N-acyltransferase